MMDPAVKSVCRAKSLNSDFYFVLLTRIVCGTSLVTQAHSHFSDKPPFAQLPSLEAEIQELGNPHPAGIFLFIVFPLELCQFLAACLFISHLHHSPSAASPHLFCSPDAQSVATLHCRLQPTNL